MGQHTDHLEIDVTRDSGLDWETGCKVPTGKVQRGTDDKVRNLGDSLRSDKGDPVVGFGLVALEKIRNKGVNKRTFFSLVSNKSLLCKKYGCIWLIHPGATKIKLKMAKSRSCRSKVPSPIIQNVKPLKRAAKM
jgi:hypothetical protein